MQSVSSRIWTRVAVSISYDDNDYTAGGISLLFSHFNFLKFLFPFYSFFPYILIYTFILRFLFLFYYFHFYYIVCLEVMIKISQVTPKSSISSAPYFSFWNALTSFICFKTSSDLCQIQWFSKSFCGLNQCPYDYEHDLSFFSIFITFRHDHYCYYCDIMSEAV